MGKNKDERVNDKRRYFGDGIFEKAILNYNGDGKITTKSNDMRDELKYFNKNECEIIVKLRTERINLNEYLYHIKKVDSNKCVHCNTKETVNHYLMECTGYSDPFIRSLYRHNMDFNAVRNKLKKKLKKIDIFFKNPRNFTTINILFPHIWQRQITNFKYNTQQQIEWKNKRLKKRVEILKAVVEFVRETKRFKTDKGF